MGWLVWALVILAVAILFGAVLSAVMLSSAISQRQERWE